MKKYKKTILACFTGYIVQAVINNFAPLLFLTFQAGYGIPLSQITLLITVNFGLQLTVDFLSTAFIDKIGYRASAVIAHICAASGLVLMAILPDVLHDPFTGLLIAVAVSAVGGGLLEVLVTPIMESCPTGNKEKAMSLLHSYYCWGSVGAVLLSTAFFAVFGTHNWKILAVFWALIPVANAFVFAKAPIAPLIADGAKGFTFKELAKQKLFWILMLLMFCAGACEHAVAQWASTFAEKGLGISKTIGDLAGLMMFALMMGITRAVYGKFGEKIALERFMVYSGALCVFSFLLISLSPLPVFGLIGCGLCGLSVGILWPGTFSTAVKSIRRGGTVMFAMLALAGDLGCSGGPTFVGLISGAFGDSLKTGILAAVIFPVLLLVFTAVRRKMQTRQEDS